MAGHSSKSMVHVIKNVVKGKESTLHQCYVTNQIVDGAKWHKGEEVRFFLQRHTQIRLEYLPPYQPTLNEQENIWRQGKYEATHNFWFDSLETIYLRFKRKIDNRPKFRHYQVLPKN